jgi:S1-C subfamily serine protease
LLKTTSFVLRWALLGVIAAAVFVAFQQPSIFSSMGERVRAFLSPGATYAQAVKAAAPSVVSIRTATAVRRSSNPLLEDPLFREFFDVPTPSRSTQFETGLGSGVIVGRQVILTNHHVVSGVDRIEVVLYDGRTGPGRIVGVDPETDLAVIHTDLKLPQAIKFATQASVNVGDVALAIGNPLGIGQTVTQGIVSATGRDRVGINTFENFIQTDAAINPGNSGGALVNQKGQLIGINAAILEYRGIGFAIPGNMAKSVLSQLLSKGEVARGWLGIEARDLSAALSRRFGIQVDNGIIVLSIIPQGPAALAGIKVGDVISKIDGHLIQDSREALRRIADLEPMKKTTITIERAGKTLDTVAMVQIRPKMRSQIR